MSPVDAKLQSWLENNRKFAETYQTPPTMDQIRPAAIAAGGAYLHFP